MRTIILSLALIAAAHAASAQATHRTECYRSSKSHSIQCKSQIDTPVSTTTTYCAYGSRNSVCETGREAKGPPPAPTVEVSPVGVAVMRGGPR